MVCDELMFACQFCLFRCERRLHLIKHSFESHSFKSTFYFNCGIRYCMHLFKVGSSYSSWKTHASRKHPNWQNEMENYATVAPAETPTVHCSDEDETLQSSPVAVSVSGSNADDVDDHGELAKSQDDHIFAYLKYTAALFLLTLKEQHKLSQASIDFAVGAINGLINTVCNSVQESLQSQSDTVMLMAEQITTWFKYEDPFSSLNTEYQQTKFYREEFGLVVSHVTRMDIHVTYVLSYRNHYYPPWFVV